MSRIRVGDRVKVYGPITDTTYYSYTGVKATVKEVREYCLWVSFDGIDPRLPHCCLKEQVHKKQCRKLVKKVKSGAV